MVTKNNPGQFDCYAKADPDEPLFVLRAKDPIAPEIVQIWRMIRAGNVDAAIKAVHRTIDLQRKSGKPILPITSEKSQEAILVLEAMHDWYAKNVEAAK